MTRRLALALLALGVSKAGAQVGPVGVQPTPLATFSAITVLPMATRAGGAYNFQGVSVPLGVVGVLAVLDVSQATDPLPQLDTILEGSRDAGATWVSAGAFARTPGNRITRPGGSMLLTVAATFRGGPFWTDATNAQRQLRGLATVGGSMRFSLTVTPQ